MVPYEVGQRVVPVELVVEERPVGAGLDPLPPTPQDDRALARGVAPLARRAPQPRRPVLHGQRRVVLHADMLTSLSQSNPQRRSGT